MKQRTPFTRGSANRFASLLLAGLAAWAGAAFGQTSPPVGPIRVACIGNSITEGGYPTNLGNLLGPGFQVENDGVSARTLLRKGDFPYWTQGKLTNVFNFKPHIVTIKLGTNDTKAYNWDPHGQDFEKDLNDFIDTLGTISTKPQVWLVLPVPIFQNSFGIRESVLNGEILPILKKVAQERNLGIIDAHTPLLNHSEVYTDGVHMKPAGNDSIAAAFYRAFEAKATKIACIGNSITQYVGTVSGNTQAKDAYALRLGMHFGIQSLTITRNYGVSGAFAQKQSPLPYWGTGNLAKIFAWKPDTITVMLGTNDSRAQNWNKQRYVQDLSALVDTLLTLQPKPSVWLTLPIPAWKRNGVDPFDGISGTTIANEVIPAIREVAEAKQVRVIDAHTPFQSLERLVADGVHPAAEGQDSLALVFYRALKTPPPVAVRRPDHFRPETLKPGKPGLWSRLFGRRLDGRQEPVR